MTESFDEFLAKRGYIRGYKHDYQVAYDYGVASRQEEVCRLQDEVDELKAMNDQLLIENISYRDKKWDNNEAYSEGQASMYNIKQKEIDELRKRLAAYEREGYKLVPIEPLIPNSEELKLGVTSEEI